MASGHLQIEETVKAIEEGLTVKSAQEIIADDREYWHREARKAIRQSLRGLKVSRYAPGRLPTPRHLESWNPPFQNAAFDKILDYEINRHFRAQIVVPKLPDYCWVALGVFNDEFRFPGIVVRCLCADRKAGGWSREVGGHVVCDLCQPLRNKLCELGDSALIDQGHSVGFLNKLNDDPDDTATLYAYADWLCENGFEGVGEALVRYTQTLFELPVPVPVK